MSHTCRCTCKAYDGHCDCWFDGKMAGIQAERERIAHALIQEGMGDDWEAELLFARIVERLRSGELGQP